jgi:hypothetical protein
MSDHLGQQSGPLASKLAIAVSGSSAPTGGGGADRLDRQGVLACLGSY